MKTSPQEQMPAYTNEFTLPPKSDEVANVIVVMRYYAPFGDGSPDGWEIPVPPPAIQLDGVPKNAGLIFSAFSVNTGGYTPITYIYGQQEGGYDQHAQVYAASVDLLNDKGQKLTVSGTFQRVGYLAWYCIMPILLTPTSLGDLKRQSWIRKWPLHLKEKIHTIQETQVFLHTKHLCSKHQQLTRRKSDCCHSLEILSHL